MTALSNATFSMLREGELALYRRIGKDRDRVLFVVPVGEPPTLAAVRRLEHEFRLRSELEPEWAAVPLELAQFSGRPALMLGDPGGEPLDRMLGRPLEITLFLRLALSIATALHQAHGRELVHKDINPANVLVDVPNGRAWLTGFGLASRLPREYQMPGPPEDIAGTLAYMSPEQTGRMNRSIDSRSDLYALGMTFYKMLTGALPFIAADPMAWVHCHIARQPVPPHQRVSAIPPALAAIVMKLLAKNAEDRYQTAAGVVADIRHCLAQWQSESRIDPFPLGTRDSSDRLMISERLYGREAEIGVLLAAFDRVVQQGATELVLVSGYSGIGKSSLVNELHKAMVPPGGLFAAGKFDQYKRNIPYATVAQALQSLVRQVIGESDAKLAEWRTAILQALGPNGQLMINLIPELEVVIGEQPPAPLPAPQDRQAHFQLVLLRFLGVFARPEHPLVLFLDDLQWLDVATLDLIEYLGLNSETRHLLLIGAYRDNEVGPGHSLRLMLERLRMATSHIQEISLAPLAPSVVEQLLADTLRTSTGHVNPLADLVYEKTAGNPFFTIQFLGVLVAESLLAFDPRSTKWRWDLSRIRAKDFTDNVAVLMAAKLGRLPEATQAALAQLACLGNTAHAATLTLVTGIDAATLHATLSEAEETGIVTRAAGMYRFMHDRIQEAAYEFIRPAERPAIHLRIGRLMARRASAEAFGDEIFDVVNQFDRGIALIAAQEERKQVAELNLMAGLRAKAATAYQAALRYFIAGRALLGNEAWDDHARLAFDLELNLAECEYLTAQLAAAERRLSALSKLAQSTTDLAAVTSLRLYLYTVLDRSDDAVAVALEYLRRDEPDWSPHPTSETIDRECSLLWQRLEGASTEALLDLPPMTDPNRRATMNVLAGLLSPAQFTDLNLFRLVIIRMAALSLEYGNTDQSCIAYAMVGGILGSYWGRPEVGFRVGKLGVDLADRHGLDHLRGPLYSVFALHVVHWTQHLATCQPLLRRAFEYSQTAGNLTFAAYARVDLVTTLLAIGDPLEEVEREAHSALVFVQGTRFGLISDVIVAQLRLIRTLRGSTPNFKSFNDAEFSESAFEQHLASDPRLAVAASRYWIRKLQACVYAGNYADAVRAAAHAESLLWTLPSQLELPDYHLYAALAHAGCCEGATSEDRDHHLGELGLHRDKIARWAKSCIENFGHRASLLGAEIARLEGRELDAMRLYEEAMRLARSQNFIQHEAMANELAARFYAARNLETIAHAYLRNARYCYERWGASGKVRQLDQLHARLSEEANTASTVDSTQLDVGAVVKASQAISGEIVHSRLLETLMTIAVEHAGADRGVLILGRGDQQRIEAEATTGPRTVKVRLRQVSLNSADLPKSVLHTATRTRESVILDDAQEPNPFSDDEYLRRRRPRSVLCLPLIKQTELIGALYLENSLASHAFTPDRIAVLQLLASQAVFSLENARLYTDLQHSEALLAEAQRLSHTGSFQWDFSRGELTWSEESFRIFGYESSTIPTVAMALDRVHPDDLPFVKLLINQAAKDKRELDFECKLLLPNGTVKYVHVVARAESEEPGDLRFKGALMDVTSHKHARAALERSESRYRHLFRDMPVALWQLDARRLTAFLREMRVTSVEELAFRFDNDPDFLGRAAELSVIEEANDTAALMFGARDNKDLLGSMEWVWRESPDTLRRSMESRLRGEPVFQETTRLSTFDGRSIDVLYTEARPQMADKVGTVLVSLVDLTERMRAQAMLQRMQAEFAHAARLLMLGELSASIAHDLNQPLTAITTYGAVALRWLDQPVPDLAEVRNATARIVADARRSADIIAGIRGMAVRQAPERKPLSLNDLILETLEFLRQEVQARGVSISYQATPKVPAVLADRVQIQQVMVNLIVNAMQAVAQLRTSSRKITIRVTLLNSSTIVCSVEDAGPGFPLDHLERLFDSFFTTKEGGMGMGLSICRSIIEAHGGRIAANNDSLHGGANFYFTLPVADRTAA